MQPVYSQIGLPLLASLIHHTLSSFYNRWGRQQLPALFHPWAGQTRHWGTFLWGAEWDCDCVCGWKGLSQCLFSKCLVCRLNAIIFTRLRGCNLCVYNIFTTFWKLVDGKEKCGPTGNSMSWISSSAIHTGCQVTFGKAQSLCASASYLFLFW